VTRPDPGIARGKWEAPAWMFWAILAIVIVGAVAYTMRRLGMLQFGKRSPGSAGNQDVPPPSSKMRRP
jgi:hypothetical protein